MYPIKKAFFTWVLAGLLPIIGFSQLNIKIGYNGGFTSAPDYNGIVAQFNDDFVSKYGGTLDAPLGDLKSLHGLEIGLRYRMNHVGIELSWDNISQRSSIYGGLAGGSRFSKQWFNNITEYSLGLENYFGYFGYGASMGYRTSRIKTDIDGAKRKKKTITTDHDFVSKFYLIFQFPSKTVGLAIKPYVAVPLGNHDITGFDSELNTLIDKSYQVESMTKERFFLYGVSIVLYNGKQ